MRCIACNDIIEDWFRKVTEQEDYCQNCTEKINESDFEEENIKFIPIEEVEDKI